MVPPDGEEHTGLLQEIEMVLKEMKSPIRKWPLHGEQRL
jgi:hypothetical protein